MPDPTINAGGMHIKKQTAYIVGGGLGLGGILWYRQHKQASAAAATAQAGANTQIDPATGYPYGSPEDAAALGNQSSYVTPMNASSFVGGQVIGYDGSGNPIYGPGAGGSSGMPGGFTNNAQWAQYVESYLTSTEGADPTVVGNAIGKYITGQPLTDNMVAVVQNAIAIGGSPPVAGPNGNPPHYITSSSGTGSTTPPPGNGGGNPPPPDNSVIVPNGIGKAAGEVHDMIVAVGLVPTAPVGQTPRMKVWREAPNPGTRVAKGSKVAIFTKGYV